MSDTLTVATVEKAIDIPVKFWAHQCHMVSLAIVKAGIVAPARVARGSCVGVGGQHSWVILGDDCYDDDAVIIDPTLWSYDSTVTGINFDRHHPKGYGSIWDYGRPPVGDGPVVELAVPVSPAAQKFLDILGPLDRSGWGRLADYPLGGWPAAEIIAAMDDTPTLSALVPIDVLGMITNRNPAGLYLKVES